MTAATAKRRLFVATDRIYHLEAECKRQRDEIAWLKSIVESLAAIRPDVGVPDGAKPA